MAAVQAEELPTAVVTHAVAESDVDAFLDWQQRLDAAERRFEGFRGSGLFSPVEGVQKEWTSLFRFDTGEHLDAWLSSHARRRLLAEGKQFKNFRLRTVDNTFGNWFAFDREGNGQGPPPSTPKTCLAVWFGLYPTVVVLTLAMARLLPDVKLWQGLLAGNLLSSFVMSYLTMPYYVNPLLRFWLHPDRRADWRHTNLFGLAVVFGVTALWAALFYLVTDFFWKLP
jgi:uncharacterized protein